LSRLTTLESSKLTNESTFLSERIAELANYLTDADKLKTLMKAEIMELAEKHGTNRRTTIIDVEHQKSQACEAERRDLLAVQEEKARDRYAWFPPRFPEILWLYS
jgi:DNA gyrase/topoisomerase IV subunit A